MHVQTSYNVLPKSIPQELPQYWTCFFWGGNTDIMYLKHKRCGGGGEIETLGSMGLWVIFGHVPFDDDGFGSALLPYQKHSLKHMKKTRVDSKESDHLLLCAANHSAGNTGKVLMTNKVAVHLEQASLTLINIAALCGVIVKSLRDFYNLLSVFILYRHRKPYCTKTVLVIVSQPMLNT